MSLRGINGGNWRVRALERLRGNLYIVFPSTYFLCLFLGRRRAESAPQYHCQEPNPARTHSRPHSTQELAVWQHTTVARKQTWNWDSLSATGCHTHRWCRLCWCCVLWLAPGQCPADRDAPGRCQPCWHLAAGAGWRSPAVSSPLSSAWCEL